MKQYAIIHVQKHSGSGSGALGRHIDRERTPENADKLLSNKNICYYIQDDLLYASPLAGVHQAPLRQRVDERIRDGYTGKPAIRKDAVKQLNVILTGSHTRMSEIGNDIKLLKEWALDNYRFLAKEYGLANIVGFVVHMDEATPHIHATIVPLTPDGRLSAKEIVGDKHKLKQLQNKYSEMMKKFGLERGEDNSKSHHIDTKEYYRHINAAVRTAEIDVAEAPTVGLPPAIIGREVYQRQLQAQLSDFTTKILRKLKEKEFKVLSLKKENTTLKTLISAKKEGVVKPQLPSRLNTVRPKRNKGLSL
jgi:hypothetical protein